MSFRLTIITTIDKLDENSTIPLNMETSPNKEKLKTFIEFIHKYFSQLLFIPLLLGGIIQFIILFSINPLAIRFFSPTQAIADGLFYLTILLLYIFSIFIALFFSIATGFPSSTKRENDEDQNKTQHKFSHEKMPFYLHIILFILTLLCYHFFFIYHSENLDITKGEIGNVLTRLAIAFIFNFGLSISLMRFIFFKEEYYFKKNTNTFLGLNFILCLIFVFIFSVNSSSNKTIPFSNFQRIEKKYSIEKSDLVKIIYFNDKFIFIERKYKNGKTELIIEKFDVLFENK